MATRKTKKIDPNDVIDVQPVIKSVEMADEEVETAPSGQSLVVQDRVANALAMVEGKAREVAVDARAKDLETIDSIEDVTAEMLKAFKGADWERIADERPKDAAIAFGILMDKREKLLSYDARRPGAKKKRTTFVFDFANQKAAVTVDDGGDDG